MLVGFNKKTDSVAPIRTIGVLNPIKNRDKYYKQFNQSGKEMDQDNFKLQDFYLKKTWITKSNLTRRTLLEEKVKKKETYQKKKLIKNKSNLK